jgi:hypothetical protein
MAGFSTNLLKNLKFYYCILSHIHAVTCFWHRTAKMQSSKNHPNLKAADDSDVNNHRPISRTSSFLKVLKKISELAFQSYLTHTTLLHHTNSTLQ